MRARIKQRLTELAGLDPKIGGGDQFLFGVLIGAVLMLCLYWAYWGSDVSEPGQAVLECRSGASAISLPIRSGTRVGARLPFAPSRKTSRMSSIGVAE